MPRSFTSRLALAFAAVGVATAATAALVVNVAFESRFNTYVESQEKARERDIVSTLEDSYARNGGWDADDLSSVVAPMLMDGGQLRVRDGSGRVVWDVSTSGENGHVTDVHREMMASGPLGAESHLPLSVDGESVGTADLRLPQAGLLPHDVEFRTSINRVLFGAGLGVALLAILGGVLVARRATRPARALTEASRSLAAGDRSKRVPEEGPIEFEAMGRAFNAMAASLDEEDRLRRRFAADVAHELRTPLAILRSSVEGMQDEVLAATPDQLASLHEEVLRLTRLVDDLETVAAADAVGFSLNVQPLALDRLGMEARTDFEGAFASEGIALEVEVEPVEILGDPLRLRQVIDNLLSNALKFTPSGGTIALTIRRGEGEAIVTVADNGVGIPEGEVPHVFDRFFRGTNSRARGSGIGLSVAHDLVGAHSGTIAVDSKIGKGTTFTVRLPITSTGTRGSGDLAAAGADPSAHA